MSGKYKVVVIDDDARSRALCAALHAGGYGSCVLCARQIAPRVMRFREASTGHDSQNHEQSPDLKQGQHALNRPT